MPPMRGATTASFPPQVLVALSLIFFSSPIFDAILPFKTNQKLGGLTLDNPFSVAGPATADVSSSSVSEWWQGVPDASPSATT